MIFQPAADLRRMSVNRPEASPPPAAVLFNSYLPVARATIRRQHSDLNFTKGQLPIASRVG